ncbi:MAG TPA: tetratricopeptide repeat protein, partial [Candidatus Eremiobacteraceae bacterium]|nr:tetratricopeptide repeat protein [Candidatus Eremiobacteraceae bacterium]
PRLVPSVVAQALEVQQSGDAVEASVLRAVKEKELLLILDNCEHLLDASASFADAVLKHCPQVRVLATSRQPLGIVGEYVHRLPSLEVPDAATTATVDDVQRCGATALFVERAAAADSRFALTTESAPIIADICRRLDGIPLAIELAAARVRVLSLRNVANRLDERFKILTGGNRTALPRQKTLSALIDWSYGLLDAREQTLFNRLGIFAGEFGIDAASAVCCGEGIDDADILELLSSLTDKSLILADTSREHERYRLLESTRAYALEKLKAAGEDGKLAACHARYFRGIARAAYELQRARPSEVWLAQYEPDIDNIRSALTWALLEDHDPILGAQIAGACGQLWSAAGLAGEARGWARSALEHIDAAAHPEAAAPVWLTLAGLGVGPDFHEMAARACEVFASQGDRAGTADALYWLAWQSTDLGKDDEAEDAIQRALAIYSSDGPELAFARGITMKAIIAEHRGDFATSRSLYQDSLARFRALGDERRVGGTLTNLGATEFISGNHVEAQRSFSEALEIASRRRDVRDLYCLNDNIALNLIVLGDVPGARDSGRAGLNRAIAIREEHFIADSVATMACVAARSDHIALAARLFGFWRHHCEAAGFHHKLQTHTSGQWLTKWLGESLEGAERERLMAEGAAWSQQRAIDEALAI